MRFDEWEPAYERILAAFGYDRRADERARDRLAELLSDTETISLPELRFAGTRVAVAGAAECLRHDLEVAAQADVVLAASGAADVLSAAGVAIDCVVTDLDGTPQTARALAAEGTPVAVHAHGDNEDLLKRHVPRFPAGSVLPTTQARPAGPVVNPGGFTDGDRAAFLADHCGAATLAFPGWDFEDDAVGATKARKLAWAERLLHWLERRRGERFGVLDGRRDAIDACELPTA